jgi:flagellar basal-body rod protein FlgB
MIFNDSTISTALIALDGLSLRNNVISQNVANVDTPGYLAQDIDFESSLQMALRSTNDLGMKLTDENHQGFLSSQTSLIKSGLREGGTLRADGNNVDIDVELVELTETGIRYNAITTGVSKKLSLLKSIATGR